MNHVSDQTKKDDNEANIQSQEKVSAVKYVTNLLSYQAYLSDMNLVIVR